MPISDPETSSYEASKSQSWPFQDGLNEPVAFDRADAGRIPVALADTLKNARAIAGSIASAKADSFEDTFGRLDGLFAHVGTLHAVVDLLGNVHPEEKNRNAALEASAELSRFYTELLLNEPLYRTLKAYADGADTGTWLPHQEKYISDTIRLFERNGLALPAADREALRRVKDRLSELEITFNHQIESHHEEFLLDAQDLEGLPPDYLDAHRQPDGRIRVDLSYPSYYPVMKYAVKDAVRKKLYTHFATRAPENAPVLKEILQLRKQMANMLGFGSYAEYSLDDKMARTPARVWRFEEDLIVKVNWKKKSDRDKLLRIKSRDSGVEERVIHPWESAYYVTRLLETAYHLDPEQVKAYFPLDRVLEGVFSISGQLFGISIREVNGPPVWHPQVRVFELHGEKSLVARLYLDLFPRKHKYGHAACFGITGGCMTSEAYRKPSAALVCNFPAPSGGKPSLLTHDNVVTLFHEFGHVLHHLLTRAALYSQSGTHVATDFVEVPSQLFENWAWEYESLKRFALHHETGNVLPRELFDKMVAARNADSGLHIAQQLFYGMLDMTLHDRYEPTLSSTEVVRKVQTDVSPYPYLDGTHMETSFGHLNGYAAGYYSYLWSRVFADDMYGEFRKNGVLDGATGRRLNKEVLSMGSSLGEQKLIHTFLGRKPDQQAFLALHDLVAPESQ